MKTTSILPILATISSLASALPTSETKDIKSPSFLLKTVAVHGTKYDGMFVIPSHTFAGGNRPGLYKDSQDASPSYLKNSSLFFDLGNGKPDQYPFAVDYSDYAAAWYECNIDINSKPSEGFKLDKNNLLVVAADKGVKSGYQRLFHGAYWRVCNWAHGYPELFLNNPDPSNNLNPKLVPKECGLVNLKAVHM